jgi:hypothetical protein
MFDGHFNDETENEIFNDRKKDASIIIRMKKKSDLRIRRSSNEDDCMIRKSD